MQEVIQTQSVMFLPRQRYYSTGLYRNTHTVYYSEYSPHSLASGNARTTGISICTMLTVIVLKHTQNISDWTHEYINNQLYQLYIPSITLQVKTVNIKFYWKHNKLNMILVWTVITVIVFYTVATTLLRLLAVQGIWVWKLYLGTIQGYLWLEFWLTSYVSKF
jgi:hypothetical protein